MGANDDQLDRDFYDCVASLPASLDALVREPDFGPVAVQLRDLLTRRLILGEVPPEQAYHFDEGTREITFDGQTVQAVADLGRRFARQLSGGDHLLEIGMVRAAISEFIIHELTHWVQGFPDFSQVAGIKSGIGREGLAMLDGAADGIGARVAARDQSYLAGFADLTEQQRYANALSLSYLIGTELFPAKQRRAKKQRAIGLIMGAVLAQADSLGAVDRTRLFNGWKPTQPLFAFKPGSVGALNALVLCSPPSILITSTSRVPRSVMSDLWNEVGTATLFTQLGRATTLFISAGVVDSNALLQGGVRRHASLTSP